MLMQFYIFPFSSLWNETIIRKNINSFLRDLARERGHRYILIEENSAKRQRTDPAWQIWPCWVTLPLLGPRSDSGMQSLGRPLPPQETQAGRHSSTCLKGDLSQTKREKNSNIIRENLFSLFLSPTITPPSLQGSVCEVWSLIERHSLTIPPM